MRRSAASCAASAAPCSSGLRARARAAGAGGDQFGDSGKRRYVRPVPRARPRDGLHRIVAESPGFTEESIERGPAILGDRHSWAAARWDRDRSCRTAAPCTRPRRSGQEGARARGEGLEVVHRMCEFAEGEYRIKGTDRSICSLKLQGVRQRVDAQAGHPDPGGVPGGAHVCEWTIDTDTARSRSRPTSRSTTAARVNHTWWRASFTAGIVQASARCSPSTASTMRKGSLSRPWTTPCRAAEHDQGLQASRPLGALAQQPARRQGHGEARTTGAIPAAANAVIGRAAHRSASISSIFRIPPAASGRRSIAGSARERPGAEKLEPAAAYAPPRPSYLRGAAIGGDHARRSRGARTSGSGRYSNYARKARLVFLIFNEELNAITDSRARGAARGPAARRPATRGIRVHIAGLPPSPRWPASCAGAHVHSSGKQAATFHGIRKRLTTASSS